MAKNKKKNTNTKSADKNSQEESFEKEEQLSEEKSSENEVESKISSEMITALEEKVLRAHAEVENVRRTCLLYTSPSPRDYAASRMPSSA